MRLHLPQGASVARPDPIPILSDLLCVQRARTVREVGEVPRLAGCLVGLGVDEGEGVRVG